MLKLSKKLIIGSSIAAILFFCVPMTHAASFRVGKTWVDRVAYEPVQNVYYPYYYYTDSSVPAYGYGYRLYNYTDSYYPATDGYYYAYGRAPTDAVIYEVG